MQINTKIISNLIIKNPEMNRFTAKFTLPKLTNLSELKILHTHPLFKAANADTFTTKAFVEAHNFKKVQFSEQSGEQLSIKLAEEIPEQDSEIKLNQRVLLYCKADDNRTNIKLFTHVKDIFNNKKLEPSYNFYELLRNCQGKDEKLDLAKVKLVNNILNHEKLLTSTQVRKALATCVINSTFNINSLNRVKELLNSKKINGDDIFRFMYNTKTKTKEIDKKLFGFSKQLLNHPNVFDASEAEDLLNLSKIPENKLNVKTTNLIMRMLSSKKLAQTESDKIHNSTACLELFETCKNKESKIDKDLFKVLENLFNSKQITDMRKTLKTMKAIQRTYQETSSKSYLREVNKLIKNKNVKSQETLLLSIESMSNERISNKMGELERYQLREAIEVKNNFIKSEFNEHYNQQIN